ncbi:hypothetical protein BsWGS_22688 [Bradybaena similaris]
MSPVVIVNHSIEIFGSSLRVPERQTTAIAFTASLVENTKVAAGQTVRYNNTITNIGNGYDTNTGIFTAPLAGLYGFQLSVLTQKSSEAWLELFVNEKYIISVNSKLASGFDAAVSFVLLTLKVGDRVQVKARSESLLFGRTTEQYCTFSGFLIASKSD